MAASIHDSCEAAAAILGADQRVRTDAVHRAQKAAELLPPFNLAGQSGNRQSLMEWETPDQPGVAGYNLYLGYKPSGPWFKLNKHPITEKSQVVGSLFNNVTTYFTATTVADDGRESRRSNMTSVTPKKGNSFNVPGGSSPRETTLPPLP